MKRRRISFSIAAITVTLYMCFGTVYAQIVEYSGDFNLRIPSELDQSQGWMSNAIIEVPDQGIINDLDVGVTLEHTKVFDLQIFIQSPLGTRVLLNMYSPFDEYFDGQDYSGTIFDDEALIPIEDGIAPFVGRFRPKEPYSLDLFDGEDIFGIWQLQVYDAFVADIGYFQNFKLMIAVPEPATLVILISGLFLFFIAGWLKRGIRAA